MLNAIKNKLVQLVTPSKPDIFQIIAQKIYTRINTRTGWTWGASLVTWLTMMTFIIAGLVVSTALALTVLAGIVHYIFRIV